jgi:hypothetical protein
VKPVETEQEDFALLFFCDQCDYKAKNDGAIKSHVTKKHLIYQIDGLEDPVTSDITPEELNKI